MRQFKYFIVSIILSTTVVVMMAYASDTTSFRQNKDTEAFNTINITAYGTGEILSVNGIRLILPKEGPILWGRDMSAVSFGGDAAEKVAMPFNPSLSEDGRTITIPIISDFLPGENLSINGLKVKTYDKDLNQSVGLDLDGDGISDRGVHIFYISDASTHDSIPTYDPADFVVDYNAEENKVKLSWKNPPDYDFRQINLYKYIVREGEAYELEKFLTSGLSVDYIDTLDIQKGDIIRYILFASDDNGNVSNKMERTVTIDGGEVVEEEPVVEPTPTPEPETPVAPNEEEEEISLLNRLFNYYNVRYQIKCLAATASTTSSACLWAKIDMTYAQKLLSRSDVDVSLSARDLYLMALRVKWPESRYQINCIQATVPAESCPALQRSLKRIHHFID